MKDEKFKKFLNTYDEEQKRKLLIYFQYPSIYKNLIRGFWKTMIENNYFNYTKEDFEIFHTLIEEELNGCEIEYENEEDYQTRYSLWEDYISKMK